MSGETPRSGREALRFFGHSYDAFAIVRAVVQVASIVIFGTVLWMNLNHRVDANEKALASLHGKVSAMSDVLAQFPVTVNQMATMQRDLAALRAQQEGILALNTTIATLTERIEALREQMQRLEAQITRQNRATFEGGL